MSLLYIGLYILNRGSQFNTECTEGHLGIVGACVFLNIIHMSGSNWNVG